VDLGGVASVASDGGDEDLAPRRSVLDRVGLQKIRPRFRLDCKRKLVLTRWLQSGRVIRLFRGRSL
jgi:hypothetical protein